MANPYVNKVVYDGNTLIDLTADTVDASHLVSGYTAHDAAGKRIVGTYSPSGTEWVGLVVNSLSSIDFNGTTMTPYVYTIAERIINATKVTNQHKPIKIYGRLNNGNIYTAEFEYRGSDTYYHTYYNKETPIGYGVEYIKIPLQFGTANVQAMVGLINNEHVTYKMNSWIILVQD